MYQAEVFLRGLFIWSIPLLLSWRLLAKGLDQRNWHIGLMSSALLAMAASGLALTAAVQRMLSVAEEKDGFALHAVRSRMFGPYAWAYWLQLVLCVAPLLVLMFRRARRSWWALWCCALMLMDPLGVFERLVILVTSLHRDYLPASWTHLHAGYMYFIPPITLLLSAFVMLWAQRRRSPEERTA